MSKHLAERFDIRYRIPPTIRPVVTTLAAVSSPVFLALRSIGYRSFDRIHRHPTFDVGKRQK